MRIGFTGTRKGMSLAQQRQFVLVLSWLSDIDNEFHHGAAEGADTQAAKWTVPAGFDVVPHPVKPGQSPLDRNRVIVANSDVLVAAPEFDMESLRSGTWATVRYARQKGIPVVMLTRGKA